MDYDKLSQSFYESVEEGIANGECYIDVICEKLAISPSYLREIVRAQYHCSVIEFIESVKLEKAIRLFSNPDLTLTQISQKCGYNLERSFRKAFNKRLDKNPSCVRQFILDSDHPEYEVINWTKKLINKVPLNSSAE